MFESRELDVLGKGTKRRCGGEAEVMGWYFVMRVSGFGDISWKVPYVGLNSVEIFENF